MNIYVEKTLTLALALRYKRPGEDESFGILLPDYQTVRHPWLVEQLESIMSPA